VHQTVSDAQTGSPDEQAALEKNSAGRVYNSPDCPVCTRLSGEPTAPTPTVGSTISGQRVDLANSRKATPDYPVCHYRRGSNGRQHNQRATHGPRQQSEGRAGLSGVPRGLSGVPLVSWLQRSALPEKEGNRALFTVRWYTGLSGAPTKGNYVLPNGAPTALSCLGAICNTQLRNIRARNNSSCVVSLHS
jgi:hypothetical protein